MAQFDIKKWKRQLHESTLSDKRMTEAEKKETLEAVSRFNEYGKHIYKTQEIAEMVEGIKKLSENASKMVMENSSDWFDAVSVKRDTKAIGEAVKVFEATAKEAQTLQQRFESVFEDIGQKLGKYYEITELEEKLDAVGKEDDDVDNDGDSDESDEYLKKKRAAISKAVKNENKFQAQVNEALNSLTEQYVVIDPRGNASPVGSKIQGDRYVKGKKGFYVILKKNAMKARRAIEKAGGNSTSRKIQDLMWNLRSEGVNESRLNEGFATWKMQFAPMTLSGVKLDPKKTFTVKARSTVEAIKKASKAAGLSGNDWMATQTHKLEKVG